MPAHLNAQDRLAATKVDVLSLLLAMLLSDLTIRFVLLLAVEDLVNQTIGTFDLQERVELLRLVNKFILGDQRLSVSQRSGRRRIGQRRASNLLSNDRASSYGSELSAEGTQHHFNIQIVTDVKQVSELASIERRSMAYESGK